MNLYYILSDDNEVFVLSSLQKQKDHEKIIEGCAALYPNRVMGEFLKKQEAKNLKEQDQKNSQLKKLNM